MGRWVRKTSAEPLVDLPVVRPELVHDTHECELPPVSDAGVRSIWECDCGRRWRIAVPHWRPLPIPADAEGPLDLPAWVRNISDNLYPNSNAG